MDSAPKDKPSSWPGLAVLAMLAVLLGLGLSSHHRTADECLLAISVLAAVLGIGRLMQQTAEAALKRQPDQ